MRSVSRLVLADDPARGLVSAAVFCFRRYSAVRPLSSLVACQLLIHLEQFGYALGFRHLCGKTVSSHLGFLFFSRRAGTNYLAYKGTKIF